MFFEKFVCIAGRINTDLHDLDRINERIPSQPLDLLLEGGAEQHNLTVGSNVVANRPNLRLETHLEHFVSLKKCQFLLYKSLYVNNFGCCQCKPLHPEASPIIAIKAKSPLRMKSNERPAPLR
jgi:hypothetical protein